MPFVFIAHGSQLGDIGGQESAGSAEKLNARLCIRNIQRTGKRQDCFGLEQSPGKRAPEGARACSRDWRCKGVNGLELSMALLKRGFINLPRLVLDYMVDLELDYELIGKLVVFLSEPELQEAAAFPTADYYIQVPDQHSYRNLCERLQEFADHELVRYEELPDQALSFNFGPLLLHLSALVRERQTEVETAAATSARPLLEPEPPRYSDVGAQAQEEVAPQASFLGQIRAHETVIKYAEKRLGRPLGQREVADMVDWITAYGFDDRVVRRIIDEGVERNVTRFSYLNQIARGWHEKGVRTLDDAENEQVEYQRLMARWGRVIQRLGLNRRPTRAEALLLEKWSTEWQFSDDVIYRACDETIYAKEPTFAYIDRVLAGWRARGVRSLEEAERALAEFKRGRSSSRPGHQGPSERKPTKSNVFLPVTPKDDAYYEQFIKKSDG